MFWDVYFFLDLLLKYKFTKARVFVWFLCSFDFMIFYCFLICFFILKPVFHSNYIAVVYIILWLSLHWKTGWPITNVCVLHGIIYRLLSSRDTHRIIRLNKIKQQYEFLKLYLYVHRFSVKKSHMCLLILNQNILSLETELTCFAMIIIIYPNKTIGILSDSEKNKWLWNVLKYYTATYKMTNTIFGLITNFDYIFFFFS